MSRALVTFGVGPHAELLEIAMPSFEAFADRHGYEVLIPDWDTFAPPNRPESWWKVPALLAALDAHDEALWVDADMVIVDPSEDLEVPEESWQAVVAHETQDGRVPNCGMWLVRQPMRMFLERCWGMTKHVHGWWWEQTAMCELLGYDVSVRPIRLIAESPLYQRTCFLDPGWNRHVNDRQECDRVRIEHATMLPDRVGAMRAWADRAKAEPVLAGDYEL